MQPKTGVLSCWGGQTSKTAAAAAAAEASTRGWREDLGRTTKATWAESDGDDPEQVLSTDHTLYLLSRKP